MCLIKARMSSKYFRILLELREKKSNVWLTCILLYPLFFLVKTETRGPENAHLKPDLGVLSHHEMTLTLNTHKPLLTS